MLNLNRPSMGLGKFMLTPPTPHLYAPEAILFLNEIERKPRLRSDSNPFQNDQRKTQAYR